MEKKPTDREMPVYSVSELTRAIRESLEGRFADIWVEGEISNYRPHGSGHHYFTLKDARTQISCVLFRGSAQGLRAGLADGLQIQACGDVTVYEARGQYQLIVRWLQPKGFGELQARFEALKRKLESEGLFDRERKKPIPTFPRTIAVVTSSTGAAIRDILNILGRRAPWVRVLIFPVPVQGSNAHLDIAAAIQKLSRREAGGLPAIDTVIVGRGGGSIEDLWSFNEESVARAIAACPIPVISAVGHEIDFTIADFVADERAPTPSAAAELVAPDGAELRQRLRQLEGRLDTGAEKVLERRTEALAQSHRTLTAHEPRRLIRNYAQSLDLLSERVHGAVRNSLRALFAEVADRRRFIEMQRPEEQLEKWSERLARVRERFESGMKNRIATQEERLRGLQKTLSVLGPDAVFERGFSMTINADGEVISDAGSVKPGDRLTTKLHRGEIESEAV